MSKITTSLLSLVLVSVMACQTSPHRNVAADYQISKNAKQLVTWETKANAVANRSNEVIALSHFEIPMRLLEKDIDQTLESSIVDSLVFEKNGEKYVRWMINPEDTQWYLEVKAFLEKNGVDATPHKFFDAYLTASRSMILVNPENGASFSLKVSTNKTGGNWTDKKQTWDDAKQIRTLDKWMTEATSSMETKNLVIMNEPLAFGIKELDHGMIMRSLNDVPKDGHYYLPGFSALHEYEGARIAKLNGATNVADFWDKHYNQPLAGALAEFFAFTGTWYDSPHSQNFLIELDKNMKPTGKIVLRDLGDSYILTDFANQTKFSNIAKIWDQDNVLTGHTNSKVGLLHGNTPPTWLSAARYEQYGKNFFNAFEARFSELSGIPVSELSPEKMTVYQYSYIGKSYKTTSPAWKQFFMNANCMNGERKTIGGVDCPEFFLKKQKKVDCVGNLNSILMAN
ncbi:hypothetical protein SHI21_11100 [Bacteriovorax sp. PP10]|uniref:Lipoprotein n=1 Tax=Bacteriovorax antarcticus TaxID=3088717 RepID=A0ABU5VUX5_9BACT|nr:hypothetical protein [Bacteriovorax sp. PP10]MEA9356757.1 hypothetical protein [Bacteriovorax sp. PP10]